VCDACASFVLVSTRQNPRDPRREGSTLRSIEPPRTNSVFAERAVPRFPTIPDAFSKTPRGRATFGKSQTDGTGFCESRKIERGFGKEYSQTLFSALEGKAENRARSPIGFASPSLFAGVEKPVARWLPVGRGTPHARRFFLFSFFNSFFSFFRS
jgi:hypothetical protein